MKHVMVSAWARKVLFQGIRVSGAAAAAAVVWFGCAAAQAQGAHGFATAEPLTASVTETVTVTVQQAGTVSEVRVLTQGQTGQDFTLDASAGASGDCQAGQSYTVGATCTVPVKFTAMAPGQRQGAVVLAATGATLGTTYLSATGLGAIEVMVPGNIHTVAGSGAWNYNGDNKPATNAALFLPMGGQVDAAGNLYIADSQNNRIRMVDPSGIITTVAGNGTPGFAGDGGQAKVAELSSPSAVAVDGAGNLYISDEGNAVIRRVDGVTGVITTIAGQAQQSWFFGDGGQATAAFIDHPEGLAFDGAGNLYFADAWNSEIRKIDIRTGIISAYAGTGTGGYNGDGPAVTSELNAPWGIGFGPDGSLYIADLNNNRVRKVDATTHIMTTVVGTGAAEYTGDGGPATEAHLNSPSAVVVDPAGNLYVADANSNRVRKVIAKTDIIETIIGANQIGAEGDGGPSTDAGVYGPYALFLDGKGDLFVSDMFHNLVREVDSTNVSLKYKTIRQGRTSPPLPETIENDGNDTMSISNLNLVSNSALDPTTDQACAQGQTMAAGDFCNLGVEFLPTTTGNPVLGQLKVETTAYNSPATINLSGEVLSVDPTQTVLTANPNPVALGATVTFTATVSNPNSMTVAPSGKVDFYDGSTKMGDAVMNSQQQATFQTATLTLGSHSITAVYEGDDNNYTSTSAAVTEVVKRATSTALTPSPNPVTAGSSVTFTATVTASGAVPTGSVTFKDGTTTLASVALDGTGKASYSTSTLSVGAHTITATYGGDTNDLASSASPVTETVKLGDTTTTLSASPNNVDVGKDVTLTVQVTSDGVDPTGPVKIFDGTTFLQSVTLDGTGKATMTTSSLAVGTHNLTAAYQGDAKNGTSTSAVVNETIEQIATTTTLSTSASPSPAGANMTLTATVTPAGTTGGTLSGTVTFKEGSTTLGTGTVDASGVATLDLKNLSVGPHNIVAAYSGATNFAPSSSSALAETIAKATTTTAVTSSVNPLIAGKIATFTATVTGDGGTPTGTVTFKDGTATLGTAVLASGSASYQASGLSVGAHAITVLYAGDANDDGSTSAVLTENVDKATTAVALVSSVNPVVAGKDVIFTATVTGNGATPGGQVTFNDGTTAIGTGTLNSAGVATWTTSSLAVGNHPITAVYAGDANDDGSTSVALNETVQIATTSTTLTATPNPVSQGATVSFSAKVTGNGAMPGGTVQFLDGTTVMGTGTLDATGVATYSTTTLTFGTHSITAKYLGDANDAASVSAVLTLKVLPTTVVTLTSNVNPAPAGATVTFTAAVSGQGSVPTGSVTFKDGVAVLGTAGVDGSGRASLPTSSLSIGTHSVTAVYSGDATNAESTSSAVSENIVQATTTTLLSTSTQLAHAGARVTLTASVSGNGGVPGGPVVFKDGAISLGTANLNASGVATLQVSSLSVATHQLTAVYGGDANDGASTSAVVQVVVDQAPTQVTVSSEANPSTATVAVTLHAVVQGGGITPTGQVVWKDGATVIGTTGLDGNGATALTTSTLAVGQHSITASYGGDVNSEASVSAVFVQTVQAATSGVSVASSANPSLYQDAILLTATVSAAQGTPTGTVEFRDGSVSLGTAAVTGAGVATLSVSTLGIGAHSIVAAYSGDADHSASQSLAITQNVLQKTAVALSPSANPVTAATNLRLMAQVTGQNGVAVTGTVRFEEGATLLGTGTLDASGVAVLNVSTLTVGPHSIVAVYSGDAKNQGSSSPALNETVRSATTQVTLGSSSNPATAGSQVTFTATVVGTGGAVTGTITFQDGSTSLGTVPLNAAGVASVTTSTLTPGPHTMVAVYSGDDNNAASNSAALTESILQTTTTAIGSAQNPAQALDPVVLTATINNGGGTPATGNVTFMEGTKVLGTAAVNSGVAVLTLPSLPTGQHVIVASYEGDAQNYPSKSPALTQVIQLRPTTDTLTATSTPQTNGQQVTLISVVRWTGPVTPTGTAVFTSGGVQLGSAPVDPTGVATLSVVLPNTTTSVVATYSGDASYAGSTSNTAKLPGNTPTQFTLSADANTATVQTQQYTVIHVTMESLNGYTDTLKLGCLGLPYAATCSFSSNNVALSSNGKQTVTLTIDTGLPLTAGGQAKVERPGGSKLTLALLFPGGLLLGFVGWRGRKRLNGLVVLAILALGLTAGLTGCASSLQIHGTPAGSYDIRVTATGDGSGVTQTLNFKLTVQ